MYCNYLKVSLAADGEDRNVSQLEKFGQYFCCSSPFLIKIAENCLWSVLLLEKAIDILFFTCDEHFLISIQFCLED